MEEGIRGDEIKGSRERAMNVCLKSVRPRFVDYGVVFVFLGGTLEEHKLWLRLEGRFGGVVAA